MKSVIINQGFQYVDRLNREIIHDSVLGENFIGLTTENNKTTFYFEDEFNSGDETYLRFTFVVNFNDIDNSFDFTPKIYSFTKEEAVKKHPHNIDYKIELIQSLYPKRTMVQGEIQNVCWFSDQALTDKVIEVDVSYVRDGNGFAVERTTTRKWILNNGQEFEETKITNKRYDINIEEQIKEGKRRRGNIVDYVQIPTMGFMIETIQNKTQGEIILMGREFLDFYKDEFQKFVESSSSVTDINDVNFGKKNIVVAFENAADYWLDNTPMALGGATIRQWLIAEFSI